MCSASAGGEPGKRIDDTLTGLAIYLGQDRGTTLVASFSDF